MKTDDPKFTAHLLGEDETLTPAERAEIEALLAADDAAAVEAAETRSFAAMLRRDLQGEEMVPLTAKQRASVLAAKVSNLRFEIPRIASFPRRTTILSAVAACLIVGFFVGVAVVVNQRHNESVRLAREDSSEAPQEVAVPPAENIEPAPVANFNVFTGGGTSGSGNLTLNSSATAINSGTLNSGTTSFDTGIGNFPDGSFAAAGSVGNDGVGRSGFQRYPGYDPDLMQNGGLPKTEPANPRAFDSITDNPFLPVRENPLSTFSTDVDTASYAIVRRFLNGQQLPPKDAVRTEELLNYFTYDYPQPKGDAPFSATMEVAACPWTPEHRLVRIGLKGREIARDKRPASNLVFLIDVSGSMSAPNRLPLVKQSLGLLIDQLGEEDRVAMVVYAGNSGCVLDSTHDKPKMRRALTKLEAGGSTNGGSGIQLAYQIAQEHFIQGGTNRVVLATDGDWNVGVTSQSALIEMITQKAKGGVFLTVLGFGLDNLNDSMLVKLAGKGNGNYAYIDTLLEAKKVLVDQLSSTLVTIAKDVKIQVEFNPAHVAAYRLIGYEKRLLAKEDFNDDKKDAGEIGAGHTVTALYEVVPAGKDVPPGKVDALKYQTTEEEISKIQNSKFKTSPEMLTLKLRYKAPDGDVSKLLEFPLTDSGATLEKSSRDFRFAAAVAGYGMLLRDSPHKGNATWNSIRELAVEGKGADAAGYRAEFISLLEKARGVMR